MPVLKSEHFETFMYCCKLYLNWYEDEDIKIGFTEIPDVEVLSINRFVMDEEKIKLIEEKPYLLHNWICVYLEDKIKDEIYTFTIGPNYHYDGATIPAFARIFIGSKGDVHFLRAALVHDVLCEHHEYVNHDRYFSTIVFERLLYCGNTCAIKRWFMKHSVDNYQKLWFNGW